VRDDESHDHELIGKRGPGSDGSRGLVRQSYADTWKLVDATVTDFPFELD